LNCTIRKNIRNNKGSNLTRAQLSRKKFQTWMIKKDFVFNIKLFSCNHSVMETLSLFFVNPCILISIILYFFQCNSNLFGHQKDRRYPFTVYDAVNDSCIMGNSLQSLQSQCWFLHILENTYMPLHLFYFGKIIAIAQSYA